jgi:hypothetical protein
MAKQLKGLGNRSLAETQAGKAAANIHASDKAAEIANRVKDPRALEAALLGKLDNQRDFAAQYRALFPHGGDRRIEQDASSGVLKDWCLSYGFALRTVQRWLELLEAAKYEQKQSAILKRCWQLAEMWQSANYSSESNEWYTPAHYIEAVRDVLGEIDLDPASNAKANGAIQAKDIFTKEDDGLNQNWFGRIFVNPPYGRTPEGNSLAAAFCVKAIEQFKVGNIEAGIILVNSLHSQSWQTPLYEHSVCFVNHRIHFVSGDGEENENPTFQNIFVYLGHEQKKFAEVFGRIGYVMGKVIPAPGSHEFRYVRHADVEAYQAEGWTPCDGLAGTHHGEYSVLMERREAVP